MHASWSNPQQTHVTLAFFKDISEKDVASLIDRVRISLPKASLRIEFFLDKLGCFPSAKRARVLWVGIKPKDDGLNRLKVLLDTEIERCAIREVEKRPFKPHLTLARFKNSCDLDPHDWSQKLMFEKLPAQLINSITFFKSELSSEGPKHSALAEVSL